MNCKHIARVYLGWFEQEAHNLHTPTAEMPKAIIWSDDGCFVIGYWGEHGMRSYQQFVRDLATSRLQSHRIADQVLLEAVKLIESSAE